MPVQITKDGILSLVDKELSILESLLKAGDRGAFHYTYAQLANNNDALLTAKISTFSDTVGGVAFASNWWLQQRFGQNAPDYSVTTAYPGIYFLSQKVAESILAAVRADIEKGGSGELSNQEHFQAAAAAWEREGVSNQFPGNLLDASTFGWFRENENVDVNFFNIIDRFGLGDENLGIESSRFGTLFGGYTGKRIDDFLNQSDFSIVDVPGGRLVVDTQGRTVATFVSAQPEDGLAITANLASELVNAIWTQTTQIDNRIILEIFRVGDVNQTLPRSAEIYQEVRREFTESNQDYNGDVNPIKRNNGIIAPIISIRAIGTSGADVIFGKDSSGFSNGDDTLGGEGGDDLILGSGGGDLLQGDAGDDVLWGQQGDDNLHGGIGNDVLRGGKDNDILRGGRGDDILDGGDINIARKDDGKDTADYSQVTSGIVISGNIGTAQEKAAGILHVTNDGDGGKDGLHSIERIKGSEHADTVYLTPDQLPLELEIDANNNSADPVNQQEPEDYDHLDLTGFSEGIHYKNGQIFKPIEQPLAPKLLFKNFEKVSFGKGNDIYESNQPGVKEVYLGGGDDTVRSASAGTQFYGGSGNDTFYVLDKTLVADAEPGDRIILANGFTLHGGKRNANSESPYAIGTGGVRYGLNKAGELVIENLLGLQMFVAGAQVGPNIPGALRTAGITLFEFAASAHRLLDLPPGVGRQDWLDNWFVWLDLFLKTTTGVDLRGVDPLVLDLDGDGLELSGISSVAPTFDMDLDGFAEPTGWATGGDGFLVLDENNNGRIDNISELFGSPAQPGFDELKTYDLNNDNRIDSQDAVFNRLRVWVDANNNAVTDPGELKTLQEVGIQSLSVQPSPQTKNQVGHYIAAEAAFTRTNGTTGTISDVRFATDNYNTVYLGDTTVSTAVKFLPNVKGKGTLTDLHIAMTQRDAVRQAVEATLPTLTSIDLANLRDAIAPILIAWGGPDLESKPDVPMLVRQNIDGTTTVLDFAVLENGAWRTASGGDLIGSDGNPAIRVSLAELLNQPVAAGTEWRVLDGAIIGFLEKYMGEPLPLAQVQPGNRTAVNAAGRFLELVTDRLNTLAVRLAAQGPLAPFFAGIQYDAVEDTFKPASDRQLIPMFEAIFSAAKQQSNALDYIKRWQPTVSTVLADFDRGEDHLQISKAYVFANIVAAYESTGLTSAIKDVAAAFTIPPADIVVGTGTIEGSNNDDIFYMNTGNQVAKGGLGADVYVFGKNFGQDVIEDLEPPLNHGDDMLRFADIKATEITATRENLDLIITVNATGDSVRIKNQFDGATPSLLGGDLSEDFGVTEIIFADGVVWDAIDIAKAVSRPAPTSDTIIGTPTIDFLDGGAGDDFLFGGDDTDAYRFDRGYGKDTIHDAQTNILIEGPDYVTFGAGLRRDGIVFDRVGNSNDLIIRIRNTDDQLTIQQQFDATYTGPFGKQWLNRIELVTFADGTSLDWDEVQKTIIREKKTTGDDFIYGYDTEDVLDGGAGNDFLSGGNENDTYLFGKDYGKDTIHENMDNILGGRQDKVIFLQGIKPGDIAIARQADSVDLSFLIAGSDSSLTIKDQAAATETGPFGRQWFHRIEEFHFQDAANVVWTWEDVFKKAVSDARTNGDDTIYGFHYTDTLDGGLGNDRLIGGASSDTYIFGRGYGHDRILDFKANILVDNIDRVTFTAGITLNDLTFAQTGDGDDLLITIKDTGETLTIEKQFERWTVGHDWYAIEEFQFADGTIIKKENIRDLFSINNQGDDTFLGTDFSDTLDGGPGNDRLEGRGGSDTYLFGRGYGTDRILDFKENILLDNSDRLIFAPGITLNDLEFSQTGDGDDLTIRIKDTGDTLTIEKQFERWPIGHDWYAIEEFQFADGTVITRQQVRAWFPKGTPSNDTLIGTDFADTLQGGAGNDRLEGRGGSDTYLFNLGDGNDIIYDFLQYLLWDDTDVIQFGAGISPNMVSATRSASDNANVILTFAGSDDSLTLEKVFDRFTGIEELWFNDGTVWTLENLRQLSLQGTDSNDIIVGFADPETFNGKKGNDLLKGEGGSDLYLFALGDGVDIIYDRGSASDIDTLRFAAGINSNDIKINYAVGDAKDLIIKYSANDSVLLDEQINTGIERIEFHDGMIWTKADLLQRAQPAEITGTDGDDIIKPSFAGATEGVFIDGKLGQDRLVLDYSSFRWSWDRVSNLTSGQIRNGNNNVLVNFKNIEQFNIIGTQADDYLQVRAGDILDGHLGKDKLDLDLANTTATIAVDLTRAENQVFGDSITQVENFETVGTITTGSGNDTIKLSVAGSSEAGTINGGAGTDRLVLDYSTYRWSWDRVSNLTDGKIQRGDNGTYIIYSNIEQFNITGSQANDSLKARSGDILDGHSGKDKLDLDLANVTTSITVDLTISENQVVGDSITQVKNFETVGNITTGSSDDTIKLTIAGSSEQGNINGGDGIDLLILDYSTYRWSWDRLLTTNDGRMVNGSGNVLLTYQNIERFNITGTQANDQIQGGSLDDILVGNGGADSLQAGLGNDRYQLNAETAGGTQIQDAGGTDTLLLENSILTLTLTRTGVAGFQRQGTTLLIDLNQDGRINSSNDLSVLDFFSPQGEIGAGFIEQINNLSGTAILGLFDPIPPTSAVNALPTTISTNRFPVSWSGTDNPGGFGIASYTIYVSENGSIFTPWLENTTLTEATYNGQPGHTYTFYSISRDNAGNVEASPATPDAQITLTSGTIAFSAAQFSLDEDGTPISAVTLTRTGGSNGIVSATLNLTNGSATSPSDYTNTPIIITFADGETTRTVNVPIANDTLYETNETINLTLSNPTGGAAINAQNTATLTIVNDDALVVLNPLPDLETAEDSVFGFTIPNSTFNAAASVSPNYTATLSNSALLPGWLTFNPTDRSFNGTPTNNQVGTLTIKVTATDSVGSSASDTFDLTIVNTNDAATSVDFNNDGKTDILWRNQITGANGYWEMNGGVLVNAVEIQSVSVESGWDIVETGDFNSDGKTDILWRNQITGANGYWEMNGGVLVNAVEIQSVSVESGWDIVETGDFNSDGKTDIIWRNQITGANGYWEMNGGVLVNAVEIQSVSVESGWDVVGTGDFTNDGKTDILWRNQITGANGYWEMNGGVLVNAVEIQSVSVESGWDVVGTGDFTNDGKTDILWRNQITGANGYWEMNGGVLVNAVEIQSVSVESGWNIV